MNTDQIAALINKIEIIEKIARSTTLNAEMRVWVIERFATGVFTENDVKWIYEQPTPGIE